MGKIIVSSACGVKEWYTGDCKTFIMSVHVSSVASRISKLWGIVPHLTEKIWGIWKTCRGHAFT
jgi:hypothetical protein